MSDIPSGYDPQEPSSSANDIATNFLTCPAVPALEPPKEEMDGAVAGVAFHERSEGEQDDTDLMDTSVVSHPDPSQADQYEEVSPRARLPWGWIAMTATLLALVLLGPLLYGGVWAGLAVRRAQQSLEAAKTAAQSRDIASAELAISQAKLDLTSVRDGVEVTLFWRSVPYIGTHLRAAEDAGEAGSQALGSVEEVMRAAADIQSALVDVGVGTSSLDPGVAPSRAFKDLTREEKRGIVARIASEIPRLKVAEEKAQIALDTWNRIPREELAAPIQRALKPLSDALVEYQHAMQSAVSLADTLLPLAGYPEQKTYLALLQNANELRPTGGFIGNIGTLVFDQGEIVKKEFQDVYDIDRLVINRWHEPLPGPMKEYMDLDAWYFRDGNWSPDFPTTAEKLLDLYKRQHLQAGVKPTEFNGVIALQPGLFRDLLLLTGPLTVDGKTFTAENFFDQLQYAVEVEFNQLGIPWDKRKDLVKRLGDQLTEKLFAIPSREWPKVLDVAMEALARKDILIYDRDPAFLRKLDARNWSGRVQSPPGDFAWVIDANLGALKTDGAMEKEVRYALDASNPSAPVATLTLVYKNTYQWSNKVDAWRFTRLRDYVRVYVPEGSELISSSGSMQNDRLKTGGKILPGRVDTYNELGKTVFGTFWSIEPGETRELTFTYRVPPKIAEQIQLGTYQFYGQKQPGARGRLTLDLAFAKKVTFAEPGEDPKDFGDARFRWSGMFVTDRPFLVKF